MNCPHCNCPLATNERGELVEYAEPKKEQIQWGCLLKPVLVGVLVLLCLWLATCARMI